MSIQNDVIEFQEVFGCPNLLGSVPRVVEDRKNLRWDMLEEEMEELRDALHANDIVETADALADIVYVAYGAAIEFGVDLDRVLRAVHESNMKKVWPDGEVHYREDGKVKKPPYWEPPNIAKELTR